MLIYLAKEDWSQDGLPALRGLPGQGIAPGSPGLVLRQLPAPGLRRRAERQDVHRRATNKATGNTTSTSCSFVKAGRWPPWKRVSPTWRRRWARPTAQAATAYGPGDPDDPLPVAGPKGFRRRGRRRSERRLSQPADRLKVVRWCVDEMLRRWKKATFSPPLAVGLLLDERRDRSARRSDRPRHGRLVHRPRLRPALDSLLLPPASTSFLSWASISPSSSRTTPSWSRADARPRSSG